VIADDHPVVGDGLSALLASVPSVTVAGRALPPGARPRLRSSRPRHPVPGPDRPGREVLDLIAAGVRNAEIDQRMSIAPKTVANHVAAIYSKL
jgi:DNA-binding NarL/FixJ family response regulator